MGRLTEAQAFEARELSASGLWSGRIAVLLGVEEREVLHALGRLPKIDTPPPVDESDPFVVDDPPVVETVAALAVSGNGWPPPPDAGALWSTVLPAAAGAAPVRVRQVRLWGKPVLIDETANVWCPHGRHFRSVVELASPDNGCPVGLHLLPPGLLPHDSGGVSRRGVRLPGGGFVDRFGRFG